MSATHETGLIVVGAGPAGVAAAMMAASLGMPVVMVEADEIGSKLRTISSMSNVPGGWTTGSQLADAYAKDLSALQSSGRITVVKARATSVSADNRQAVIELDCGATMSGSAAVVATGVAAQTLKDTDWVSAPDDLVPAPLWRTVPNELHGYTHVIGGDRPLGTWLRAHPASRGLHVLVPTEDDYKMHEVAHDARVTVLPVAHVSIEPSRFGSSPWRVDVERRDGTRTSYAVDTLLSNLGSRPAGPTGLVRAADGYCPPTSQHPRVLIAGDLRSARFQRIAAAQGSGAEAALAHYYDLSL